MATTKVNAASNCRSAPTSCCRNSTATAVPQPAKPVELSRYLGHWYELARYEQGFQKDCDGVTADYALRADGKISVLNKCRKPDGSLKSAEGKANPGAVERARALGYDTSMLRITQQP